MKPTFRHFWHLCHFCPFVTAKKQIDGTTLLSLLSQRKNDISKIGLDQSIQLTGD